MKLPIRHIITLIIALLISFVANADMSHPASSNFSDVFATTTDRYQYSGKEFDRMNGLDLYDFHARQYDPVLGRFTTPDPLSEKYYHLSPYAYCASNPLKFIDPDGCNPRVYVETKGLGHVCVTTGTGKNTIVYTYGRYGDIYKNKSSARSTSPIGQGILVILKGEDAAEFIKEEINNYDAEIFEFTKASDIKVENYFMELFNSSDELPKNKKYANNNCARVVDDYNLFTNNCTTTSIKAISAGGGDVSMFGTDIAPLSISKDLNMEVILDNIKSLFGFERKIISVSQQKFLDEL